MVREREEREDEDSSVWKAGTSELSLVSNEEEDCDESEVMHGILADDAGNLVKEEEKGGQTLADVKELIDLPFLRKSSDGEE